jgi:hypothetical protein
MANSGPTPSSTGIVVGVFVNAVGHPIARPPTPFEKAAYRVLRKTKPLPDDELNCSSEDLLVFFDDTGHESFGGNQEYYGLGGCVVPGRTTDG